MNNPISDFERNVQDLQSRIERLRGHSTGQESEQVVNALARLEDQTSKLRVRRYANLTTWERIQIARHPNRPHTLDYVDMMCTDWMEIHGDRRFADDPAMVAGLGRLGDRSVAIIGQQKGRDTRKRILRNYGMAHPEGYRKALRVMKMAERFGLPVVSLVDTAGAYPGLGSEERGIAESIAVNLREMALLRVPIVVVVIGEGGSGGALGIGVGDVVMMLENAWYSVISPEGCASILWRTPAKAPLAAEALRMTAPQVEELGIADEILPEPLGGAHANWQTTAAEIKARVISHLDSLSELSPDELVERRIERFCRIGVWQGEVSEQGDG